VAADADIAGLICAVALLPANVREYDGASPLLADLESRGWTLDEVQADRGYLPAPGLRRRCKAGMRLVSKPPTPIRREGRFSKADFSIDIDAATFTCPAGKTAAISQKKSRVSRRRSSPSGRDHVAPQDVLPLGAVVQGVALGVDPPDDDAGPYYRSSSGG